MHENAWPGGQGEMAALVRGFDWAATPLGPAAGWPGRLRMLVETLLASPVPAALFWGADQIMIYNDAYISVCGDRHPQVLGAPFGEAWPEAREFGQPVLAECRAGRARVFHDMHFRLARGGVAGDAWFDMYLAPVLGDDGRFEGVQSTIIESTARVLAERARAATEEQLRSLNREQDEQRARLEASNRRLAGDMALLSEMFRRSPSFMTLLLGPEHRFQFANESYERLVQHRDVIGKPLREALPEVAQQGFVELLDKVYRSGEAYRGRKVQIMLDSGDGQGLERRILDFIYQPLKDEHGRSYGIFVEGVDVTEHALAEERLRVAQDAGEIGTFEWYPDAGELLVSDSYRRVYGIGPDVHVDDELLLGLVDPAFLARSGARRRGRMANPLEYAEYPITRPDTGERRWIARRGQLVDGDGQQGPRYLGVAYDITDRKNAEQALIELNDSLERRVAAEVAERIKAEDALRQAQKMEAVGQLASGVAHDFNNVLQIISSNMQLMECDPHSTPSLRARLSTALAAVERGARLSGQLLAFARRQPLQPVVTHLGTLLHNIEPLLRRALGDAVALEVAVEPGLWHAAVDPNQMENALLNLTINARDAMAGGGRFSVALRNQARGAGQVVLSVRDTGCGMPPAVLARVFEPFFTTKEPGKGTGLGMSMVYGFVKQSGGEIRIDSAPGAGTAITIELPRADGLPAPLAQTAGAAVTGGSETILVAEDDPALRDAVGDMLRGLGYTVLSAADAAAALAIVDSGAPVDLVFSDVSMPGPVDSTALVLHCRAVAPHTALLLTSGHAIDRSLLDARLPDAIELLPKPYGLAQLAQALRRQLAARAPEADSGGGLPAAGFERSVLVVDDDSDNRELACEMLNALGHRARGVDGAPAALELLRGGGFDVLFTDLNMPGMDGDELAGRAAQLAPGLDIIISSGEGRGAVHGGALLLPKPYDLLQLQRALESLARAPAAG